jgi:sec-independent protein translocase protein TatA
MLSGISPWSILLILIIVVVLFGTKKLRNVGADLGAAMKSFKKSSKEDHQVIKQLMMIIKIKILKMFDIGFWELFFLFLLTLFVLGPEKLPEVASFLVNSLVKYNAILVT